MPAIVEFPQLVLINAFWIFHNLCFRDEWRKHFAVYLTGLMIAQNKTVAGIKSEFAQTTDQSCVNRFLTDSPWKEKDLNELCLELMQGEPDMCYSEHGVITIGDTLIDHCGKFIEDFGVLLESCWRAQKTYPRLSDCELCVWKPQALPVGVSAPLEMGTVWGHRRSIQGSLTIVLQVGWLDTRPKIPQDFRIWQLFHQCGDS